MAEINANHALQQSKEKPGRGIVIIQENEMIREAVGQEENIAYFSAFFLLEKENENNQIL